MKQLFSVPSRIKGFLYAVGILLLTEGCFSTPFQKRKTTIFGTVTDNDTKLPVDSVQILIMGIEGISKEKEIDMVYTNEKGMYSILIDVPKGYSSLLIINEYFRKPSYSKKYRSYLVFNNGQQTMNCCRVDIGAKTQYDFMMLPK